MSQFLRKYILIIGCIYQDFFRTLYKNYIYIELDIYLIYIAFFVENLNNLIQPMGSSLKFLRALCFLP